MRVLRVWMEDGLSSWWAPFQIEQVAPIKIWPSVFPLTQPRASLSGELDAASSGPRSPGLRRSGPRSACSGVQVSQGPQLLDRCLRAGSLQPGRCDRPDTPPWHAARCSGFESAGGNAPVWIARWHPDLRPPCQFDVVEADAGHRQHPSRPTRGRRGYRVRLAKARPECQLLGRGCHCGGQQPGGAR